MTLIGADICRAMQVGLLTGFAWFGFEPVFFLRSPYPPLKRELLESPLEGDTGGVIIGYYSRILLSATGRPFKMTE